MGVWLIPVDQGLIDYCRKSDPAQITTIAETPTEGQWFNVKPASIDLQLFEKRRQDPMQEWVRKNIIDAFAEAKRDPQKYFRDFQTMMPKRGWFEFIFTTHYMSLLNYSFIEGMHYNIRTSLHSSWANWVFQSFEWAQRIQNTGMWEPVCNEADTSNYYRLVLWGNDHYIKLVGGSQQSKDYRPPAKTEWINPPCKEHWFDTVPLIFRYNK